MKDLNYTWMLLLLVVVSVQTAAQQIMPSPYSSNIKVNSVRIWKAIKPYTADGDMISSSRTLREVRQATAYFDGLCRPLQTVVKRGSLVTGDTARDLVSPVVYDAFGRDAYKYVPFAANNAGSNTSMSDGFFKLNPFQQDSTFNKGMFPDESYYYGKTVFEASPLNRVLETFAPGNNWVGTAAESTEANRRGVKTKYWINTVADSVRIWSVTNVSHSFGTYATSSIYPAGQLHKSVTLDEHNNQVIEFKDKGGKVVLKKVQLFAQPDTGIGKNHLGWLCTYYIYDDMDNLRAVIQPKAVEALMYSSWALTSTQLAELCFRYEYDARGRMITKKVPGSGRVQMVYDARDRLVLTQDSIQRLAHQWLYVQYDDLNRPVATGLLADNSYYNDAPYHRSAGNGSVSYPASGTFAVDTLTKTFYDDYTWRGGQGNPLSSSRSTTDDGHFLSASNTTWPYPQDATVQSSQLTGMVTGTKTKVLGTSTYLYSVSFYDDKGRVTQTQSTNVTSSIDYMTTQYSWNSQPLLSMVRHQKGGTNSQTTVVVTKSTYDDLGRLLKTEKKISNTKVNTGTMPSSFSTINQHEYDALGQLKKKKLGTDLLETMAYEYNIRGWMLGANRGYVKDTASTTNWFGFDLGYDKTAFTVNGGSKSYATAQHNGNIGGMLWRSTGDDFLRKYDFTYDAVNRLTGADFNQLTSNSFSKAAKIDFSVSGLNYDANGNILNMNQRGWKLGGSVTIDSLLYTYTASTNKLVNVLDWKNDTATRLGDFRSSEAYMVALSNNKTTGATDYSYDVNGNMYVDNNKNIGNIHYNHLNLPDSITVTNKGHIKYVYDAAGNKLKKITTEGAKVTTTLYLIGNYINDTLQFIGTEEGRARPKGNISIVYDYFIKDHLGNIRMVLTEETQTDSYPAASMEDVVDKGDLGDPANYIPYYTNTDYTDESGYRHAISAITDYPVDEYTEPNEYLAKLNSGQPMGPAIALKVMAGDKFNLRVSSWYKANSEEPGEPSGEVLNEVLLVEVANGVGRVASPKFTPTQLSNSGMLTPGVLDFFTDQSGEYLSTKPKAFLNWILFDEQLNYVSSSSGFEQVGDDEEFKIHLLEDQLIAKSGYLYIYVSNETPNIDVLFDNLQVTHIRGPLLEETHYYPFGLTMNGISSKALVFGGPLNTYKFNEGTELANNEFTNGSGLEMYETVFRGLDPQTGRFLQIDAMSQDFANWSPYVYAINNPMLFNDPLGLFADGPRETSTPEQPKELENVTVTSSSGKSRPVINFTEISPRPEVVIMNVKPGMGKGTDDLNMAAFAAAGTRSPQAIPVAVGAALGAAATMFFYGLIQSFGNSNESDGSIPLPGFLIRDNATYAPDPVIINIYNETAPDNKAFFDSYVLHTEKTADELLPGSLKKSPSYNPQYGNKTRAELQELAKAGDQIAKKMKKLVDQIPRLLKKNKNK